MAATSKVTPMPDYASILRRSVSGLADPSAEMREAVYQRARAALARQLTAVDPPLSTREIELQHQELEDAVARLEAEFAPQMSAPTGFGGISAKEDFLFSPQMPSSERRHAAPEPASHTASGKVPASFEEEEEDFEDDDEQGSRLPLLIGALAVVLVVVGAGAWVYAERDSLFGGSDSASVDRVASVEPAPVGVAGPPETDAADSDKRPDRLTNGAESPPTAMAAPTETTMVPPEPAATPGEAVTSSEGLPLEDLSGLRPESASADASGETNLVEQRAIYYYQGSEGQPGQASQGSATWAEITKDGRPAIQANLTIAERNVTITVTIYKNYDTALPASHLVEVSFSGALSDSPIQRVPALVLKQTEQARGQPLAGAAVPVTNDLFWIALSSEEEDVSRNIQLLREGSWFDIPILFSDQTRALITFEKGIPGDKVFETVMASWTPS
jgi:hypothetical protein